MLRSRFFWRIYVSYLTIVLVTTASIGLLVRARVSDRVEAELEASLLVDAMLLEPLAARALAPGREDLAAELAQLARRTGVRITLVRASGEVVSDSDADAGMMESHLLRPEIQESLRSSEGVGTSRRTSQTVGYPTLYVARRVRGGGESLGFVRVGIPLEELQAELRDVTRTVGLGAGAGVLLASLFGLLAARRITAPLEEMTRVAEDLRSGRYDSRVRRLPRDEIGVLGRTLNRLGEEVTERIERVSRDDAQKQAILAGMIEGVVALDEEERFIFCNEAAHDLLKLGGGDVTGRRIWEVVRIAELTEALDAARRRRTEQRREIDVRLGERNAVLQVTANPFLVGGSRGVMLVVHDITELRRLEQIRRDFVANVSHELKTPLTSIRGYVETLLGGAIDDQRNNRRFLEKIARNVERLSFLVSDLLSLARIESEGFEPALVPIDLYALVRGASARHAELLAQKGIAVSVGGESGNVLVRGDRESLVQILDNLLGNAAAYTPAGGQVAVTAERDGSFGLLRVRDSGIGIPPEDLGRIFERFYRVDKARSREVGGTGLGLSIVKHLVARMDGQVEVESELGRGSLFTVRIPLA